ncbi:MAG: NUDIX domain-containing protein [Planctomycetes bacterium]|nr:NUDIX domain-containing protein [Planctomycetota bacterium]
MNTRRVVTAFLSHGGKVLILKRAPGMPTYPGKWGGVSGAIEKGDASAEACVRREIEEELRIADAGRVLVGEPFELDAPEMDVRWIVHPALVETPARELRLSRDHTEARWIAPEAICEYDTVPRLEESLARALAAGRATRGRG